jgi:hypothetical protein
MPAYAGMTEKTPRLLKYFIKDRKIMITMINFECKKQLRLRGAG